MLSATAFHFDPMARRLPAVLTSVAPVGAHLFQALSHLERCISVVTAFMRPEIVEALGTRLAPILASRFLPSVYRIPILGCYTSLRAPRRRGRPTEARA